MHSASQDCHIQIPLEVLKCVSNSYLDSLLLVFYVEDFHSQFSIRLALIVRKYEPSINQNGESSNSLALGGIYTILF
jgi:hypothetical protein